MRSFRSLAWRQIRARRLRALLTTAGIVLGVGMIFGVLLLSATIRSTFTDLFDSVYGKTDLVVSGKESTGSLPRSTLRKVRGVEGVEAASANVFSVFTRIDESGKAPRGQSQQLNVVGIDPDVPDLTDVEIITGREVTSGREIQLQQSWAKGQKLKVGDGVRLATPAGARRFLVVGLFEFSTGLDFGGQGFGAMPIAEARRVMDKPDVLDEIDVIVAGGEPNIAETRSRLRRALGRGVVVETPKSKSDDVEAQLQGFNVILYFFAAMALFVGGFLIFNAFNMTVLQRMREIGMLRTLGAGRRMISRSVLREATMLGAVGAVLGLAVGFALAGLLVRLMRTVGFPVGDLVFDAVAPAAAVTTGLVTAMVGALVPSVRAGRIPPIRAILGAGEARSRPRRRRAAWGVLLVALGMGGAFWLGAAPETTTLVAAAGMLGVVALLFGIALIAPFVVVPMARVLSWPIRRLAPVEGRMAADSARSNPTRTAATSTALMIGLALVVAFGTIGSSFLNTIADQFDKAFARDLTVQPRGFAPGQGPQQTIATSLRDRVAKLAGAEVVARERIFYVPDLPRKKGKPGDGLVLAFEPDSYEKVDTTEIEGAPRLEAFRRLKHGEITVGKGLAGEGDIEVGDHLTLKGPSGSHRARVAGLVKTVVFGGETIGMSLQTARKVYGVTADSQLAVKATSPEQRGPLQRRIERIVERDHPNLVVLSNDELKDDIESQVNQQFGVFNAILGVAVIVSLFGIINTLSMSVIERTRELGLLRALGASRWQVRRAVVHESMLIALIGAALGVVVGTVLGWALLRGLAAGVPGVGYSPPVATMFGVVIAGVVLGLLAAVLPARRAARLNVIEALSYE